MEQPSFKVYGYRWVVLLAYMMAVLVNQLLWITFAPITSASAAYFGVSDLSVGLLSMSFMIVYIVVSIPASWAIDTWGIRAGVGIGVVLTAVFGLLRGLAGANYTLVLIAQIGIAIGQPFILNATTKLAARWFPIQERATASGLGSLAIYVGILIGLALTPALISGPSIHTPLMVYGVAAIVAGVAFFALTRERPPSPPCLPGEETRSLALDGLKDALHNRSFLFLLVIFFIGLGVFNAVTTWIEDIVRPRGFTATQAGLIGGLMVIGGVIGALILPALSDRCRRRVPFITLALAGSVPALLGITLGGSYGLLLVSAFALGLFLLSSGPVGFQYGAESTYPAPEGTSNGMLLLMGQISGIGFIFGMDAFKSSATGSMTAPLVVLIVLLAISVLLSTRLKESGLIAGAAQK